MPVHTLPAAEALARLDSFDTVIDARTEDEHALDHVPGAINWPTLNNQERIDIGTMYKQVNPFEAKKRGAALSARNIAAHIEREVIDGGYKAWRAALVESIPALATRLHYRVVCGPTGSGKTRLLQALAAQSAQVLDLEALASHRSSVLGHIPGQEQPSQKRFDSLIWDALRHFDPARAVYVESESKKVGNVRVPDALIDAMRASPCIDLQLSDEQRVALLLEDYDFFVQDPVSFCSRLEALTELRGKAVVSTWIEKVQQGHTPEVVLELLTQHYDPMYAQSIARNFKCYGQALPCVLRDRSAEALADAARRLIATGPAASPA